MAQTIMWYVRNMAKIVRVVLKDRLHDRINTANKEQLGIRDVQLPPSL